MLSYPALDLDTCLVAVYCVVDDLYRAELESAKPSRPGHRPELSDSEVLTLARLAQWQQGRSERAFLRYAQHHWRAYFPRLLSQSAFNRRARDLGGVLARLGPLVSQHFARALGLPVRYAVMDSLPIPLMRRCRGERHRLFGPEADIGQGGSDQDGLYGVRWLGVVNSLGLLSGFVVGPASTAEWWLAEAVFRWRLDPQAPPPTRAEIDHLLGPSHKAGGRKGPTGPLGPRWGAGRLGPGPVIADLGFRGLGWQRHWQADYGASLLTKEAYAELAEVDRRPWERWLDGLRQLIETAFQGLTSTFGMTFPRARTYWGLLSRLAAKVAAFDFAVCLNHQFGRPPYAFMDPLS